MKRKAIIAGVIISFIILAVLFAVRFFYSITYTSVTTGTANYLNQEQSVRIQNFASSQVKFKDTGSNTADYVIDQKYEKTAYLTLTSAEFEKDDASLTQAIESAKAIIQYENRTGLPGYRSVYMSIGVHPSLFDSFIETIKKIGHLASISINKVDKTSEYKNLEADKLSLENARDALAALKGRSGDIGDLIELQNRILEIEEQIKVYNVQLGQFDEENEFCTVHLTFSETVQYKADILKSALASIVWAVKYYLAICTIAVLSALFILIGIIILQKLKNLYVSLTLKNYSRDKNNGIKNLKKNGKGETIG